MINLSGIPSNESRPFFTGRGRILAYIYTLLILSCGAVDTPKPDEGRFSIDVLAEALDEPMGMTVLPGEKVLIVERRGALKMYDPVQKVIKTIAVIPVNVDVSVGGGYTKQVEEGLMGVIAHPDFEKNHWIFLYHADTAAPRHLLSRWEFRDDQIVPGSQKVIMEVPISREVFKCSGGSMAFDKKGNLYLAVGTNTHYIDTDTMFTPAGEIIVNTNEPETAGNTNDLRGKILRIHPNDDGSYTVPEGNLFTEKDNKVRPEIYVMGVRNPWRISIDSKTGYLFWADPGRDDDKEDVAKNNGKGMDEFNVATGPGNYGWPFFVGDNRPYYAPIHSTSGQPFSPGSISNTSSRNTGRERLPSARSSIIQYKYSVSDAFPLVGGGGRSAVGGPVFRSADFSKAARPFPSYYEGKWFVTDFIRGWIMLVEVDRKGKYVSMEPFLPQEHFSSVLDMQFSPEGDLYLLQYGTGWFTQNSNARLVKISYQSGNRKPVAKALADKRYASTSAKIHLNGRESNDPDGDSLKYHWFVRGNTHSSERQGCEVSLAFDTEGIYDVRLVVTDPSGATSEDALQLHIGNAQPEIDIDIVQGNETFYFPGDTIRYKIEVNDAEEGSTRDLSIPSSLVERSFEYFSMGHRILYEQQKASHESISSWLTPGGVLINNSDCRSCHTQDKPSIGPSYESISRRYRGKEEAISSLAQKIISGGSGIWGDQAMSAHPHLTQSEAEQMTAYILSLGKESKNRTIPLTGEYIVPAFPAQSAGKGSMVIQAAYKDRGTSGMESVQGYAFHLLRNPFLDPEDADIKKGMRVVVTPGREVLMEGNGAHAGFRSIDLAHLSKVEVTVIADLWRDMAGGQIECRLDSLSGPLVGISRVITATEKDGTHTVDFIFSDHSMKGKHDVYFVFINRRASPTQLLMELSGIRFIK